MSKEKKKTSGDLTEGKKEIISKLLEEYDINTAQDIQDALRDLLGGTIKGMMEAEMQEHLGYKKVLEVIVQTQEMVIKRKK